MIDPNVAALNQTVRAQPSRFPLLSGLHQPHSAIDENQHTKNGQAGCSSQEQFVEHQTLPASDLGLKLRRINMESVNRPVSFAFPPG